MSFLKIICLRPGYRRAGIALGAVNIRPADAFTTDQIDALRADPLLTVTNLTAEEAEAELRAPPAAEVASPQDATAPRKIVTDVLRLLMPEASEPLLVQTSSAVLRALDEGTAPVDVRAILEGIFRAHAEEAAARETSMPAAWEIPEGRSGTAREAPSTDSGSAAPAIADAADGAQPAAPSSDGAAPGQVSDAASANSPPADTTDTPAVVTPPATPETKPRKPKPAK